MIKWIRDNSVEITIGIAIVVIVAVLLFCGFVVAELISNIKGIAYSGTEYEAINDYEDKYGYLWLKDNNPQLADAYEDLYKTCVEINNSGKNYAKYVTRSKGRVIKSYKTGEELTQEDLVLMHNIFKYDNPYFYYTSVSEEFFGRTEIKIRDEYRKADVRSNYYSLIEEGLKNFDAYIQGADDDFEKVVKIYDYIANNVTYARDANGDPSSASWAHSIIGYFESKSGVCETFAKTFKLFCDRAKIESVCCITDPEGEFKGHAWNLTKIDGDWYAFCATNKYAFVDNEYVLTKMGYKNGLSKEFYSVPNTFEYDNRYETEYGEKGITLISVKDKQIEGDIEIPKYITTIGKGAFKGCNKITRVNMRDNVVSIEDEAFMNCNNLETISLSSRINSIGKEMTYGCYNLQYNIYDNAKYLGCKDNEYFALIQYAGYSNPNCLISNKTKLIANRAFFGNNKIVEIVIPSNIDIIGESSFAGCSSLKSVVIEDGVESIGFLAFMKCAFKEIVIPQSVNKIDHAIFYGCNNLEKIMVDNGNKTYDARSNCNAIVETKTNTLIAACKSSVVDGSIEGLEPFSFAGIVKSEITLPMSVKSIGDYSFSGSSIRSIYVPTTVTYIQECAFSDCSELKTVVFGGTIAEWNALVLDKEVFKDSTEVEKVVCIDGDISFIGYSTAREDVPITLQSLIAA